MKTKISILGLVFIFLVFASGWAKKIYAKAAEAPLMQLWESYSPSLSKMTFQWTMIFKPWRKRCGKVSGMPAKLEKLQPLYGLFSLSDKK